jgi:hypothetical protein
MVAHCVTARKDEEQADNERYRPETAKKFQTEVSSFPCVNCAIL